MGKAIIVSDVSFAGFNLGSVTPIGNVPVQSIAIQGPDSVTGAADAATFTIAYTPADTNQRRVNWSISSGSEYATISSQGVLSVLPGANNSSVTIRAESNYDPSIVDTKQIVVTRAASSIWDAAADDPDFGQYMTGMQVLYQGANIVKSGSEAGTSITQPISSLSQDFVFLVRADFPTTGGATQPAIVSRLADNFCIARISGTWKVGGNWPPTNDLQISGTPTTLYVYYNRTTNTIVVKNATSGQVLTFNNVTGYGTLRDEAYIGGGSASTNNYTGTIYSVYIGG